MDRTDVRSDEELARLAVEGDRDAFAVLSDRYLPIIHSRANRYSSIVGVELEDFQQEGLLALYRAARGYQNDGQAAFRTYATTCINNSMTTAIRRHMRQRKQESALSLEQLDLAQAGELSDREAVRELSDQIQAQLSPFERQVLLLYLSGHSYAQIAQLLSTSAKPVDNALQRVRRKLRHSSFLG